MEKAVVVDVVRSPIGRGKKGGSMSSLHAVELLAQVIKGLLDRNDFDPAEVEDVLIGCVSQAADQAGCPGRAAWLAAGGPEHVPAVTIDRRCGSSQQALQFGAQAIMAGTQDIVIVGGLESMSRIPLGSARMGVDPFGPSVERRYAPGLIPQGISAELIASRWNLNRHDMDSFSARSHQRAEFARANGLFEREIVPIDLGDDGGFFRQDETIRPSTTEDSLAGLGPSFASDEMKARYPEINWSVTAGNASQLADGASAALVMSESKAAALGLAPMALVHSFAVVGSDPVLMLTGPIPATQKILQRSGFDLDQISHFEVNEAFASVPLAWTREFGLPDDDPRLNPHGGAIALGHPLGASGIRLLATMLHSLSRSGERYGMQVMCEGTGMANATIIENLQTERLVAQ